MNSSNFSMLRNTDTDSILIVISNFLSFFETLKICFIIVIAILMMSPKMTTLSLLKIKVFWNKGFDVMNSVDDVTKINHVTKI